MTTFYFDIETIPATEDKIPLLQRLHAEKVEKEETLGLTNTPRDFEAYFRRTSLNGAFGQIFCLSFIKEKDGEVIYQDTLRDNEAHTLKTFWELTRDVHCFVGHGIRFFDLKFITQRSIIHGIPFTAVNLAKFRDNPVYDTME